MNTSIMIATDRGSVEVEADVFGNLAVHQHLGLRGLGDTLFALTFVPTGGLINTWQDKQNAIEAAQQLAPHFDGTPDKKAPEWKDWQAAVWPILLRLKEWEAVDEMEPQS